MNLTVLTVWSVKALREPATSVKPCIDPFDVSDLCLIKLIFLSKEPNRKFFQPQAYPVQNQSQNQHLHPLR